MTLFEKQPSRFLLIWIGNFGPLNVCLSDRILKLDVTDGVRPKIDIGILIRKRSYLGNYCPLNLFLLKWNSASKYLLKFKGFQKKYLKKFSKIWKYVTKYVFWYKTYLTTFFQIQTFQKHYLGLFWDTTDMYISLNSVNWDEENGGLILIIEWCQFSTYQRATFFSNFRKKFLISNLFFLTKSRKNLTRVPWNAIRG